MFSKDIDIDYSIMAKHKIPILINDKEWKKIFESVKDRKIDSYKDELAELLKEQKRIDRELIKLKKEKKKTMLKILNVSEEVNNTNNSYGIEMLDQCQQSIIDINTKLEDYTFRSEMLPTQIREVNFKLLKETIKHSYKELQSHEKQLSSINKEIDELRKRLKTLIDQKHNYEEKKNITYRFLHGILGGKEMEKLDKNMLE